MQARKPSLSIAVIAHIRHPIAEPYPGGMESHTALLCKGLRDAGHRVTLFAARGSHDQNLSEVCDPYERSLPWHLWHGTPELAAFQENAFAGAMRGVERGGFDVVHNNSLFPPIMDWAAGARIPLVTSQHVPPFGPMRDAVSRTRKTGQIVTIVSHSQKSLWDPAPDIDMRIVRNGVDCRLWKPVAQSGEHVVWSGRVTPNKGLAEAVAAARIADVDLQIFGPMEDPAYFENEVAPMLDDRRRYLGHLDTSALRERVASARAAMVTPMWDEPFGLVAAEALACGVPVAAFDRGGLREVVAQFGRLAPEGDVDALAVALREALEIDRSACRAHALSHLSVDTMIEGYEQCYADAITGCLGPSPGLSAACSSASSSSSTTALLA